jgi:hypothetical protein
MSRRIFLIFGILSLTMSAVFGGYWFYSADASGQTAAAAQAYKTDAEKDTFVRFDMEIFDIIMTNYWQKGTEADLAGLYQLALAKAEGVATEALPSNDRVGTAAMLGEAFKKAAEDKRKELAVNTGIIVLANLAPQGRSGLLSDKQEQEFRDTANNINRENNLYSELGVKEGASTAEVQQAFDAKKAVLEASSSPAAKAELAAAQHAHEVLADTGSKAIYDETKIEPSVVSHIIGKSTLYLDLSQVTPATLQEFVNTLEKTKDNPQLTSMIIDVRGNIGGTLDFAKYLLALFVGPNQYAFDLFHQGEMQVERTPAVPKIPSLKNFKEIAILTDAMTQSTAELTTTIFKRMHMAIVVGTKTRGWGTVENTFPITTQISTAEKYSVLLVHSLTLREDNEPVEGKGVDPDIDVSAADWKQKVANAFRTSGMANAVIEALGLKK